MIREAVASDIPRIVAMGRNFHGASHYAGLVGMRPEDVANTVRALIESDDGVMLVHEHGMLAGVLAPFFFNSQARQAIEMFWYAEKDGRQLFTAFEEWARDRGAVCVVMGSLVGDREQTVARLYQRRGYTPGETLYLKRT